MTANFNPFAGGEILRVSPTTGPQKEVIASAQMSDEANTAFNEAISLTFNGSLDRELLLRCFEVLIARHDLLRATFSRNGKELCLQDSSAFKLQFEDLRALTEEDQQGIIADLWRNIAISPMNLEEGPLLFAWLKQLKEDKFELTMAAHHVICDGWSIGLMLNELAAIYRSQGSAANLAQAESFFDFAEQADANEIANRDIDFWRDKFKHLPPVMDLPLDKPRPKARSFAAARFDFDVNPELVAALPKLAGSLKSSLVNVVLAAYFVLLHRLTGEEDLVVGLPVAGQAALKRLNQVGHMVQLLPIRIQLSADAAFADVVAAAKREVLNASEHPNFTFGKLVENLPLDRSRVPLVSTIFNIDQPMPELDFASAKASLRTIPRAAENFEIFLNILPSPGRFTIEATYSTRLFSEASVTSWLSALENILRGALADAQTPIGKFVLAHDVPQAVQATNATEAKITQPDFIHAFAQQVAQTPEATAVIAGEHKLSYRALDQLANVIAHKLIANGIKEGAVVGLCSERSHLMLASVLGILKTGAAYLPLDPDFPPERLLYMMEDSGAQAVIEDSAAPASVKDFAVAHIDLAAIDSGQTPETLVLPDADPQRLAYTIYTSGSTGKPKGVRIQNRAMINFLESMQREPGCSASDRLLAVTTLSFDISVLELYLPLICGGTVVVASRAEVKEGEKLAALLAKHDISVMQATPSTWRLLLASSWREKHGARVKALCGGEALPPDLVADLLPRVAALWNMFGPTETTVWSTCKQIQQLHALITVGKPIANTQVYVLDTNQNILPLSAPGELYIGGEGVTLGYHNRPELNAERFITHPKFGRIYRTGDQAKCLPNGEIQHLGRLDDQVKLRGYRIELGEIEAALAQCDSVASAAVYLWQLSPEDVRIVACCVAKTADGLNTAALRKQLREILPAYMLPQYFLEVDSIPLTPNGKVNRRALPKPEVSESTILATAELRSDTEKTLAEIWTDLIKPGSPIGREDNFFEVGGHSLLALEAIRRTETATGVRLTAAHMVAQRLAALAEIINQSEKTKAGDRAGPQALSATAERRLSLEQQRILQRQIEFPGSICNNLPAAWVLQGKLDRAAFDKALARVFDRQTALRTWIQASDGYYVQNLLRVTELQLPDYLDCSAQANPLDIALADGAELAAKPFAPLESILVRVKLYKLAAEKHLLVLVPHQLVFDGWSFDIFLKELEIAYKAFLENQTPHFEPLAIEFRDYAQWASARSCEKSVVEYHQQALDAATPFDFVSSDAEKGQGKRLEYKLESNKLGEIESFCESHGFRLHEVLFAGLACSIAAVSKSANFTLGLPVTGRYSPEVIGLVGGYVSVLPCNLQLRSKSFVAQTREVAAQLKACYEHQDLSFAELLKEANRDLSAFAKEIAISFGFQDIRNRPADLAGLGLHQIDMPRMQTEFPIEFWTRIQKDSVLAVFDFDSGQVDDNSIDALAQQFLLAFDSLHEIVEEEPQAPLDTAGKKPLWRRLFS